MDTNHFCFWLQGFVELNDGKEPIPEQWRMIKEHLSTVFMKVTPPLIKTLDMNDIAVC